MANPRKTAAKRDERQTKIGVSDPLTDKASWDERLEQARIKREKVLAQRAREKGDEPDGGKKPALREREVFTGDEDLLKRLRQAGPAQSMKPEPEDDTTSVDVLDEPPVDVDEVPVVEDVPADDPEDLPALAAAVEAAEHDFENERRSGATVLVADPAARISPVITTRADVKRRPSFRLVLWVAAICLLLGIGLGIWLTVKLIGNNTTLAAKQTQAAALSPTLEAGTTPVGDDLVSLGSTPEAPQSVPVPPVVRKFGETEDDSPAPLDIAALQKPDATVHALPTFAQDIDATPNQPAETIVDPQLSPSVEIVDVELSEPISYAASPDIPTLDQSSPLLAAHIQTMTLAHLTTPLENDAPLARGIGDNPRIAPVSGFSVLLHAPSTVPDTAIQNVSDALSETGLSVRPPQTVSFAITASHVRYFYNRDASMAQRLADTIGGASRDFTDYEPKPAPGIIEVWLKGDAAPSRNTRTTTRRRDRDGFVRNINVLRRLFQ